MDHVATRADYDLGTGRTKDVIMEEEALAQERDQEMAAAVNPNADPANLGREPTGENEPLVAQ